MGQGVNVSGNLKRIAKASPDEGAYENAFSHLCLTRSRDDLATNKMKLPQREVEV